MSIKDWLTPGGSSGNPIGDFFNFITGGAEGKANRAAEDAAHEFDGLTPEQLRQVQVERLGPSAYEQIKLDPAEKAAQLQALNGFQARANQGLDSTDRAALNEIAQQQGAQERGSREAILANARARGVGGGGAELLSQLQNGQDAATRAANAGYNVAAQDQAARMQALGMVGQMGTQMRGQDYAEQERKAQARDAIDRYNSGLNLQQQAMNNEVGQQNWQNRFGLADARARARAGAAGYYGNQAAGRQQVFGGTLQSVGQFAGNSAQKGAFSDKRLKKDVEPGDLDVEKVLESLAPKSFKYKDPGNGKGVHVGIMAQDLEKTPAGKAAVIDTPEGKMIHAGKAAGLALAAVAHLHQKLKNGGK